jgi:hypothetical protein
MLQLHVDAFNFLRQTLLDIYKRRDRSTYKNTMEVWGPELRALCCKAGTLPLEPLCHICFGIEFFRDRVSELFSHGGFKP